MALLNNTAFANREVCDMKFCKPGTSEVALFLNYANTSAVDLTEEVVYAYGGKGHPKRVTFHGEKSGTLTIETQMQTIEMYQFMTGAELKTSCDWLERELVTCADSKLTIKKEAKEGSVCIKPYGVDNAETITGTATGTDVTGTGLVDGTQYEVYYLTTIASGVKTLPIKSTSYAGTYTCYADTYMVTDDGETIAYKYIAYKVSPQGNINFGFSNSGDPATITITCDLMADADGNYLDLIFDENAD